MSQSNARSVLIVDDNKDITDSLALLLDTLGYETHTASDGAAALEAVHHFQPDMVILDIHLPDMSGYQVAPLLRKTSEKPIVLAALSGYAEEEDGGRSETAGFDYRLTKPVKIDELQTVLAASGQCEPCVRRDA